MLEDVSGGRVEVAVKSIVSEILSRMSRPRVSAEYSGPAHGERGPRAPPWNTSEYRSAWQTRAG
jgi:hypothetical protein